MPSRSDWKALVRETVRGVEARDVRGLYDVEWRKAVRIFLSEHRDEIDAEPRKVRRALRKANALVFGMVRRLTPARRVAFVAAVLFFVLGVVAFRVGPA